MIKQENTLKAIVVISFVVFLMYVTPEVAHAQWSTSGGNTTTNDKVGIGLTNPSDLMELWKATSVAMYITRDASGGTGKNQSLALGIDGSGGRAYIDSTHYTSGGYPLDFRVRSNTYMTVDVGGNVGIGTTSPTRKLDVNGGTSSDGSIRAYTNGGTSSYWAGLLTAVGGNSASFFVRQIDTTDYLQIGSLTNNNGLVLKDSGNVGIGTASPSYPLHVNRSASDQYLGFFENTQSSPGVARLRVQNTASQGSFEIDVWDNGNTYFQTGKSNNSPSLSILSGNVGIGTTNPYTKLHVSGGDISVEANQGIRKAGDNWIIGYVNSLPGIAIGSGTTSDQVTITAGGSERIRVLTNGNVGIGNPSPQYKLDVTGTAHVTGNMTVDGNISAKYQDVAEWVPSSEQLSAGTVVVVDSTKSNQVTASTVSYDTRVAGVVSEQPGIALGEKSDGKVLVATTGRVRVKVDAAKSPIHIGDLLVTSDVPGMAMKSAPMMIRGRQIHAPGTLIGKALEPFEKGKGSILVLLSLQ